MAQEIQKQLINPVPLGGIPVFADDLLRVQENAKNSIVSFYEGLSRGGFRFFNRDVSGAINYGTTAGLFLSIPKYTEISQNGNSKTINVSEFFCVLDGEVCYYAGGDLDFAFSGAVGYSSFAVIKGEPIKNARVFRNGVNNETLITHTVELVSVSPTISGWIWPANVDGRNAVQLDFRFSSEDKESGNFYQNHPNWFLQSSGIVETTNRSIKNENDLSTTNNFPTLVNGSAITSLNFYRSGNKFVQGRGQIAITGAQSLDLLFNLPSDFVVGSRDLDFVNAVSDSGVVWMTRIQGDGNVVLVNPNGTPSSFTGTITFDGVSYYEGGF